MLGLNRFTEEDEEKASFTKSREYQNNFRHTQPEMLGWFSGRESVEHVMVKETPVPRNSL